MFGQFLKLGRVPSTFSSFLGTDFDVARFVINVRLLTVLVLNSVSMSPPLDS
jgi:hypothetical protein